MTPADAIRQPALKLRPSWVSGAEFFFAWPKVRPGGDTGTDGAPGGRFRTEASADALIWVLARLYAARVVLSEAAWNVFLLCNGTLTVNICRNPFVFLK